MPNSQNGWPVDKSGELQDREPIVGARFPNGVLRGDVATVFRYLMGRLHREVEPIKPGTCWGWYVKNIEGSTSISNHASGTALDYNADAHPMGVRNTYNAADRAKIRAILDGLGGVVRWGGDYVNRPDDMHFEIHATKAAVGRAADRIRAQQEESDMTADQILDALETPRGQAILERAAGRGVHNQKLGKSNETIGQDLQGDDITLAEGLAALKRQLDEVLAAVKTAKS